MISKNLASKLLEELHTNLKKLKKIIKNVNIKTF